jgi:hypothetical protein
MHGEYNVKFSNAQQAKSAYNCRNTKEKLHKTIASIWFKQICKLEQLSPKYIHITVIGNNRKSFNTKNAAIKYRINQELKYLYKKKRCIRLYLWKYSAFVGFLICDESYLLIYQLNCFQTHHNEDYVYQQLLWQTKNIFHLIGWSTDAVNKALMFMYTWYKKVEQPWTDNHATGSKITGEIFNYFSSEDRNMTLCLNLHWQGSKCLISKWGQL